MLPLMTASTIACTDLPLPTCCRKTVALKAARNTICMGEVRQHNRQLSNFEPSHTDLTTDLSGL